MRWLFLSLKAHSTSTSGKRESEFKTARASQVESERVFLTLTTSEFISRYTG